MSKLPASFRVRPSWAVTLIDNVMACDDAENDAEKTVDDLLAELDLNNGYISRATMESALYCCNMQSERLAFRHPQGLLFKPFLKDVLPEGLAFDLYYNRIYREQDGKKTT
jgi:hypothetical protein